MKVNEFIDRLYALNQEERFEEILEFAEVHAAEMIPQFNDAEHMTMQHLVSGAAMTLDLEEHFGQSSEPIPNDLDARALSGDG